MQTLSFETATRRRLAVGAHWGLSLESETDLGMGPFLFIHCRWLEVVSCGVNHNNVWR